MSPHFDLPAFATVTAPTSFYFVRHGESEANRKGIIQGRLDPGLSATGRSHAESAGRWFASRKVDRVFTSPLQRAAVTAAAIAEAAHLSEPEALADLQELDTGIFSGLVFTEIEKQFPAEWRRFQRNSWESVPEAERIHSLHRRSLSVWRRLIDETRAGSRTIVCVTHVGMLQWIVRASMGGPPHAWMPVFKAANCGIFRLSVAPVPAEADLPASFFAEWDLFNEVPYDG